MYISFKFRKKILQNNRFLMFPQGFPYKGGASTWGNLVLTNTIELYMVGLIHGWAYV